MTGPAANGTGARGLPAGTDAASLAAALIKLAKQERELAELRDLVKGLAAQGAGPGGAQDDGYEPAPTRQWWKLAGADREAERAEAIKRLAAWVERVFRPGYGHLAARLGPCWWQHDLCLYTLDWLSEFWTLLYADDERSPGHLASQAEFQTRILAAAAEQLGQETAGCQDHEQTGGRWPQ